jgi:PAT family beta-lactamase induction signal transducer AmpG
MAIANLGRATGSGVLGPLRSALPWEYVILSIAGFAVAMLILIQMLRMQAHQERVDVLEKTHLDLEAARAAGTA